MTDDRFRTLVKRPQFGMADYLRANAERDPANPCLVDADAKPTTFGEADREVDRLAHALSDRGVVKGDRIAILATDSVPYVLTILACMRLGAIAVPINVRLNPKEYENLFAASTPKLVFYGARYGEDLRDVRTRCDFVQDLVCFEEDGGAPTYDQLVESGDSTPFEADIDDDTPALCMFTSGTTGTPKGVLQSHGMLKSYAFTLIVEYEVGFDEFRYVASPLFHIGGLAVILMGIVRGYPHLILPQFDPGVVLSWLQRDVLTACTFVPTMINALLKQPGVDEHDYTGLRTLIYGSAPITPDLLKRAMSVFTCDFIQAFGAGTEGGLQTVLRPADHRRGLAGEPHLLTSVGKPVVGVRLRICDDDWNDVPRGEVGEIVTTQECMMSGYFDMPEATSRLVRDGWFRGGDAGWLDDEGFLYLSSRKKDMIIRGGVNIYPLEIESVLCDHDAVAEAAVVGKVDSEWGELVVSFVVKAPGEHTTEEELKAFCREHLAPFKVPVEIHFSEEFALNASGKVDKGKLRELLNGTTVSGASPASRPPA